MRCAACLSFTAALVLSLPIPSIAEVSQGGVSIRYQLPADGPLPKTYRVTLAIIDPKNPDWIVSTFVAGEPRDGDGRERGPVHRDLGRAGRQLHAGAAGHVRRQGHLHAGRAVAGRRRVPQRSCRGSPAGRRAGCPRPSSGTSPSRSAAIRAAPRWPTWTWASTAWPSSTRSTWRTA